MRKATAISAGLHAAVLLWAMMSFSGKTFEATPAESLPVDLVSDKDFSRDDQGRQGRAQGRKAKAAGREKGGGAAEAGRRAEAEGHREEGNPGRQGSAPPPEPQPPKPDPIADKIKKPDEPKPQTKVEPQPLPPKKPPPKPQPKFDADKIAALLDKRDPQRKAATGAELNSTPSLGTAIGHGGAAVAIRNRCAARAPDGACGIRRSACRTPARRQVTIRIRFKRDGTLAAGPQVLTSGHGAQFNAMRDSAVRAVFVGQPYTMLRPDHYDMWKEIDFTFDTKQMFHDLPAR